MKKLLLIDGDELVYKASFASQHTEYNIKDESGNIVHTARYKSDAVEWIGNDSYEIDPVQIIAEPSVAQYSLFSILNEIFSNNEYDDYKIYFSGKNNFREGLATILPYKGNRDGSEKPFYYDQVKDLLKDEYGGTVVDGIEADDALSIMQWQTILSDALWETTIVSQDKDLMMVPGWHYNPTKSSRTFQTYDQAKFCFYKQLLTGDSTDNIHGIYRMGEKTAVKILTPYLEASEGVLNIVVLKEYANAHRNPKIIENMPLGTSIPPESRMREVGRLLWMLQDRGQLWCPAERYYEK